MCTNSLALFPCVVIKSGQVVWLITLSVFNDIKPSATFEVCVGTDISKACTEMITKSDHLFSPLSYFTASL